MNFSNLKQIQDHLKNLVRISDSDSIFKGEFTPIECGSFIVRTIAEKDVFCKPRLDCYNSLLDYSHIAVIIQEKSKLHTDAIIIVSPTKDLRFQMFSWTNYFNYFNYQDKITPSYIGSNLPIEELPQLIKDVNKINKLKLFF